MRVLSRSVCVVSSIWLGSVAACGSGDGDGDEGSKTRVIAEPIQFDASVETRKDLGVERWGMAIPGPYETIVRGYDRDRRMTVEIRREVALVDPTHKTIGVELRGEHGAAVLRTGVMIEPGADEVALTATILENGFFGDDHASRTLAHAEADTTNAELETGKPASANLLGQALRIQELTDREKEVKLLEETCAALLSACNVELLDAEKSAARQSAACRDKANTWSNRTLCSTPVGTLWPSDCKQVNDAASGCAQATQEAIKKADASGNCVFKRDYAEACADPAKATDKRLAEQKRANDAVRESHEKEARKHQEWEACRAKCLESSCDVRSSSDPRTCEACHARCLTELNKN